MLTGKTFTLDRPTMAFTANNGRQRSIIVPTGSTVEVVSSYASQMADVLWDGLTLTMFVHDLDVREAEKPKRPI